ncbi:Wzz/FepE/Etk N-terminal domain-containing protein [Bacillus thuringiensis]|nr:Wzz/FepE/Etk N-terminal domain-containing protein [Bacillus thuringiensis]
MRNITINEFWKIFKSNFIIISIIPIVVIAIVYMINRTILPPKYETTTQLVITMQKINDDKYFFDNLRSSMQLVDTFSSIAQSEKVMEEVKKELKIEKNSNKIKVVTDEKSLLVDIKVVGKEKEQVVDVANAIAINTKEKFKMFFQSTEINVLDKAIFAKEVPITTQLILGFITGLMASFIYIFSILTFSTIIRKEEHVTQLGFISLGDVPLIQEKGDDIYD